MDFSKYDFNYIEDMPAEKQQFYWVGLFYFLAETAIEMRGGEGEAAIREGVRAYGLERGQRMRKISDAKGLPANILTLFDHYDLMSDPRFEHPQEGRVVEAEVKKSITSRCPDAEMWSRLPDGLQIGAIYCEEVHHQIYSGYDPAIQVNLCETLTNGGDQCRFHIYCRKSNQKEYPLPAYERQSWEDFENNIVASIHTIFCLMYLKMGRLILDKLGEDVLCNALKKFCIYRGKRMRLLQERKKTEISLKSFLEEGDVFLDSRFHKKIEYKNGGGEAKLTTERNIMREISESYHSEDLAWIYEKNAAAWELEGYDPSCSCKADTEHPDKIHIMYSSLKGAG